MFTQELEDWQFESTRYTSLADEHSAWHAVHGWNSGCPLDCAAADAPYEPTLEDEIAEAVHARGIPCGKGHRHTSIADVAACYGVRR